MTRLFLLAIALITTGFVIAQSQPTINRNFAPYPGLEFTIYDCDTTDVEPGPSGANQTWDFSDVTPTGVFSSGAYLAASETPHASLFPNANIAYTEDGAYVYYDLNDSHWRRYGLIFSEEDEVVTETLTDPADEFRFPMSYGDSFEDTFAGELVSMEYTLERAGTNSAVYDGYGTLITPEGTFNNVVRVKYEQVVEDEMFGMNTKVTTTDYLWMRSGDGYMLMSVSITVTEITSEFFNDTEISKDVSYGIGEGTNYTINPPTLTSPENGAEGLTIPVRLEWEEVVGGSPKDNDELQDLITEYNLQVAYSDDASFEDPILDIYTTDNYFEVYIIEGGQSFIWRVQAMDDNATSEWSEVYSFSVEGGSGELVAPTLISPTDGEEEVSIQPLFVWDMNENANSYMIQIAMDNSFDESSLTLEDETTFDYYFFEDEELELFENTTYFWRVMAKNNDFESEWSEVFSFTTGGEEVILPDAPLLGNPENEATEVSIRPTLEWSIMPGLITDNLFTIEIATDVEFNTIVISDESAEESYTLEVDLEYETTYYWRVSRTVIEIPGKNGNDQISDLTSEWSETYSFTTESGMSVSELKSLFGIEIYPNPTSDAINLFVNTAAEYQIIDLNGNTLIEGNAQNNTTINLDNLNSGIYFIKLDLGNKQYTEKIIKK